MWGLTFPTSVTNKSWKKNLNALMEDLDAGDITRDEFCKAAYKGANPEIAAASLEYIGRKADYFDWWFVSKYGNEIKPMVYWATSCHVDVYRDHNKDQRLQQAFHRAVLNRRELE
tara:strand:+ start:1087 stop:1431 length:345 start_codon:yes stop_codon:yes gene_type:complete